LKKKPEEYALEFAGFWIRLGAAVVDLVILIFILSIILYVFSKFIDTVPFSIKIIMPVSIIVSIAYLVGFSAWRGQTPGKIVTGIKIIRTDSSPLSWQCALLRYFGYIVSTLILFIGFIWIAIDSHKQGLHDKIADTYVVKLPVRQVEFTTEYLAGG
jgi:uncharacterized RDD family membrane protein YckC